MKKFRYLILLVLTCFLSLPLFADTDEGAGQEINIVESESNGVELTWKAKITSASSSTGYRLELITLLSAPDDLRKLIVPDSIKVTEPGTQNQYYYKVNSIRNQAFSGWNAKGVTCLDFSQNNQITYIGQYALIYGWDKVTEIVLSKKINEVHTEAINGNVFVKFSIGGEGNYNEDSRTGSDDNRYCKVVNGLLYNVNGSSVKLVMVPKAWLESDLASVEGSPYNSTARTFTLPSTITTSQGEIAVTGYEANCFLKFGYDPTPIKDLYLSANVTSINRIGDHIENVYVDGNNPKFMSFDGVVYTKNRRQGHENEPGDSLLVFPPRHHLDNHTYTAPSNLMAIVGEAFFDVDSLYTVDFSACTDFERLTGASFKESNNLEEVRLPRYVKYIATGDNGISEGTGRLARIFLVDPITHDFSDSADFPEGKTVRYWSGSDASDPNTYGILYTAKIENNKVVLGDTLLELPCGSGITDFRIPDGVKVIGDHSCRMNGQLTKVSIPESVKEIEGSAFFNPNRIRLAIVEFRGNSQLEIIGSSAIRRCHLVNFDLPSSVKTIGSYAFAENDELLAFNIPADTKLTSIGSNAFDGCVKLQELDLSSTKIDKLPSHLIRNTGVISLSLPSTVESIAENAFNDQDDRSIVSKLREIHFASGSELTTIGPKAFAGCKNLESIDIPEGVKTIGNFAFSETNLKSIYIPKTVKKIGSQAFAHCARITSIDVDPENEKYISLKGILYAKPNEGPVKKLLAYPSGKSTDDYDFQRGKDGMANQYSILPSIEEIGDSAFYGCEHLEDLKLPPTVKKIGNGAFLSCKRLSQLSIMSSTPPALSDENRVQLFSDNGIEYIDKPVLIVRAAVREQIANNSYWKGMWKEGTTPQIFTSFKENTTGMEYFPWSELRQSEGEVIVQDSNNQTIDSDNSSSNLGGNVPDGDLIAGAKAGFFDLEDNSVNDNPTSASGFTRDVTITNGSDDAVVHKWHFDKVAVMGIDDETERNIAKTFIIPASVAGSMPAYVKDGDNWTEDNIGANKTFDVAVVADSAFYDVDNSSLKVMHTVTMQGNPEYISANAFNNPNLKVYLPGYDGTTKPLASESFVDYYGNYNMGMEFADGQKVFVRKSLYEAEENPSQIVAAYKEKGLDYKIPVAVNKVASKEGGSNSGYYAGTFCREFDVDFSDCEATCSPLLFWVMKGYKISVTDKDEQDAGIKHYYKAWSFPSTGDNAQKLQLKAGDGVLVRVTANPDDLYCTFYEKEKNGNKELKAIAEFGNPDATSTEEGINTQALAPNALVGVYARTYMAGKDGRNFSKGYKNFAVHPDGTPTGNTNNVDCGYIMGWKTAENAGCFVLVNYDYQDKDNKNSQFTAFKAFLGTGITEEADITTQNGKQAQFLMIWDGDMSTVTDVRSIFTENAEEEGGAYYTVSGQRVEKPTAKGLYIHNGKKVLVK